MKFNEKHHAYISALYYMVLSEGNYKNYENAFMLANRKAGEQRGFRMALRAIRDGVEVLDFSAYRYYGEWAFTEAYLDTIKDEPIITPIESQNDYAYIVHHCPWAEVYHELGIAKSGGRLYCKDIDASIIRGFNPALSFKVTETLQDSHECVQYQVNGSRESKTIFGEKNSENVKGFDYQCGHIYKVFSQVILSIYPEVGMKINRSVLSAFGEKFGREMANKILSYQETDFTII